MVNFIEGSGNSSGELPPSGIPAWPRQSRVVRDFERAGE